MTLSTFEELFDLETWIREYDAEINTLELYFEEPNEGKIVVLDLKLHEPLYVEESSKVLKEIQLWGSGNPNPGHQNYGLNARIMNAAVKAMIAEIKAVNAELIEERDRKLSAHS